MVATSDTSPPSSGTRSTLPPLPKPPRNGCIYIASELFASPEAIQLRSRSIATWVFALCWMSQMRRDTQWVLPHANAREIFTAKDIDDLLAVGWLEEVDGGYTAPRTNRRGGPIWKPGQSGLERAPIPQEVRLAVYRRDGFRCVTCGTRERLTLDHIYPWSLGGSDDESNLQTMCHSCNARKGARV